jgi:hypothetical protein
MSLTEHVMSRMTATDEDIFRYNLGSYVIIDIGTLETYVTLDKGIFGVIRSNRISGNKVIKYGDVELLQIGNSNGGFKSAPAGEDIYLVFCTLTTLKSTVTRIVDSDATKIYSINGMKAIPVTSSINWKNSAGFDREGNFLVTTPGGYLKFGIDDSIKYQQQDILSILKNKDGSMSLKLLVERFVFYFNADGTWVRLIQKEGVIKEWMSYDAEDSFIIRRYANAAMTDDEKKDMASFENYLLEEKYQSDGTVIKTRKDDAGEPLWVCTYNPDGSYSRVFTDTVTETIDAEGNYEINFADTYIESITADGKKEITSEGYSINASGGKIEIKNSAQSMVTVLSTLIDNLSTLVNNLIAAKTVGSPALHTFDPSTIANLNIDVTNLSMDKTNLEQLME